jgi:signal transduction histidine kinase/ActR/RegA family two-component response regulator
MPNVRILGFRGPAAASRALRASSAAIIIVILLVAAGSVWQLRGQAERAAQVDAQSTAVALAAHAHQVFSSANFVLDELVAAIEQEQVTDVAAFKRRFGDPGTHTLLRGRAQNFQAFEVISLVAADGDLVNFSRAYPVPAMNIRDREGVVPRGAVEGPRALLITAPRIALINGQWTFYLVRQLRGPDGQALGIVQAGINTAYFSDFYERVRGASQVGADRAKVITLLRADAVVLATAPRNDAVLGTVPGAAAPAAAGDTMVATRSVAGFPASVSAAVSEGAYLAAWRSQAMLVAGLALLTSVLLGATFSLLVRALRRREQELEVDRRLRVQAELADRAKGEFLSTITHELRTPMNGVLGTAELLLHEVHTQNQRELVQTLMASGRHLLSMINDVLDLTKIEAGEVLVRATSFDPVEVLQEVRGLVAEAARAKGLELRSAFSHDTPRALLGDAGHVREILIRLVGNAIKFTDRGHVAIDLQSTALPDGRVRLRYVVEDTGQGLPADAREKLFKPFFQVDASAQRRHEGAGLGLALSQKLASLLGGRVDFESSAGSGSRFWLELELALDVARAPAAEQHSGAGSMEPAAQAPGRPRTWPEHIGTPHVLVVEDNPVNAMIVQQQLANLRCTSELAEDGEVALRLLRQGRFDLVLMDCMLPKMSGYDATLLWRAVEQTEGRKRLPIVALTANSLASNVALCEQAGMDDFLTKPVSLDRLHEVVSEKLAAAV